jgi:hypothetical protein
MEGLVKTILIASVAGGSVLAGPAAHAGEPLTKLAISIIHAGGSSRTTPSVMHLPANRLDLAPPSLPLGTGEKAPESFPASNRHTEAVAGNAEKFGGLSGAIGNQRVPSRAEQLVRNFHRDGLPIARLFQSENSLVHLGLNQKGKPGLWIVEKIH